MLRVTKTENGAVKGFPGTDARITVFKGIPFADNASGANRWKAPQPVKNWEGVRECYEFAPITWQKTPGKDPNAFYSKEWHVDSEVPMSEDGSLALNIWTPAKTGDEKLPVMVWIFGGGLQEGYAYEMEFDGERIASRGVILVTVAYRLNVFGFLAHPELTAEDPEHPCNFGFLDQQAGIKWVKRNIANFGGDPDNITVFGQSSGGVSVFSQMCSETNKGLFQKAIVESSAGGSIIMDVPKTFFGHNPSLAAAEAEGVEFFEKYLGVKTLAEARALPAAFVEEKCLEGGYRFGSVTDNKFLTKEIEDYIARGEINDMPLMLGWTGDEFIMHSKEDTDASAEEWIKESFGAIADDYIAACKQENAPLYKASAVNINDVAARMVGEFYKEMGRNIWLYNFDPEIPGDDAGSFHSSDLWFQFETLMKCWRPFDGHHYDLSRKMCNYWTNFAKYSNPNGNDADGTPMPEWKTYNDARANIEFFDTIQMASPATAPNDFLNKHNCDIIKAKNAK